MATYKVIQDIEAEDKLLGPLTLRQFIYAIITVVNLYLCFLCIDKHVALLVIMFFPVALFFGFFAWPWSLNQPTEVWALAKIRFFLKPHKRIWDQSGAKELVTVLAPKNIIQEYTNGLSQGEVRSRLKALADTIDTRGWAVKTSDAVPYVTPGMTYSLSQSDRLIDISNLAPTAPSADDLAVGDMLDDQTSPIAQHFNQMIGASVRDHREQIIQEMQQAANGNNPAPAGKVTPNNYWFLDQPEHPRTPTPVNPNDVMFRSVVVQPYAPRPDTPKSTEIDSNIAEELKSIQESSEVVNSHLHHLSPISDVKATGPYPEAGVLPASEPAILNPTPADKPKTAELAQRNDLNVATLERLANSNEVVVDLQH